MENMRLSIDGVCTKLLTFPAQVRFIEHDNHCVWCNFLFSPLLYPQSLDKSLRKQSRPG